MTTQYLVADIEADEGCRTEAYQDSLGIWTIGVGHVPAHEGDVWTTAQCDTALAHDLNGAESDLDRNIPWWSSLNDARQDVMVNMCFNLGWPRLSEFHNMLAAAKRGDYETAADEMLDSKWAKQLQKRSARLAEQMRTGVRA